MKYLLSLVILTLLFAFAEQQTAICRDLRKGRFYAYSKRDGAQIVINRSDSIQQDINLKTKDTVYWKIRWNTECSFSATYLGGSDKREEVINQRQAAVFNFEIQSITPKYYIGKTTVRSMGRNDSEFTDTTWFMEKARIINN